MPDCDFTRTHYENILELINESGYKVKFFNESNPKDRELIIRHDVDIDLGRAYSMALVENRHGIRSTYFIMIRSPFYNIFDRSNTDFIKGISDMGHQIGLHFDEAFYDLQDTGNIAEKVDTEAQILKDHLDMEVFAVSFHRPSRYLLQSDVKLEHNLINTYDRSFAKDFKYISDSRREWKDGCLCSYLKGAGPDCHRHDRIQVLVHPVWWTDRKLGAQETIEGFLIEKLKHLDSDLEKNIQVYKRLL